MNNIKHITFTKTFTKIPTIVCNARTQTGKVYAYATNPTVNGFDLKYGRDEGTSKFGISWIAIVK